MSWKWFATGCALLTACLLGMSSLGGGLPQLKAGLVQHGEGFSLAEWAEQLDQKYIARKIALQPYAQKVKAQLIAPEHDQVVANGSLPVTGVVWEYGRLASPYVWIHVEALGKKSADLPDSIDYYTPVNQGRFSQTIHFFQGKGDYRVSIRLPDERKANYYYLMTIFTAHNENDRFNRDIVYSVTAKEVGLSISNPGTGFVQADQGVWLNGNVGGGIREVLVQLRKGSQVWRKEVRVDHGKFQERLPLLFGQGVHEIQVLVPERNKVGYFIEGATLYVEHTQNVERNPITFTSLYAKRGIHLIEPVVSGDVADSSYRISGTIDPTAEFAKQTHYLIVRTKKGTDKATYFIPVSNYRFDGEIWLRFGAGKYDVALYVPEITQKQRDYFRFFTVAEFEVNSTSKQDLRYLLPSRGIESDDPTIKWLAHRITKDTNTDREKAKAIYTYVAETMNYDVKKFKENEFALDDSALKSLRTHSGVCQDYVFLSIALLRASDIPSRFVEGVAGGQRHAWVEAELDGRWVTMDPTWGSGYITPDGRFVKKLDMRYFDPSKSFFDKTHKRTGIVY